MLKIDTSIIETASVISKNIDRFDDSERGLLSQNILAQLRNLVEYIAQKIYSNGQDIDPNNYSDKKEAWEYIKSKGSFDFLHKFHGLLQKSVSHYTIDENGSERLMLKYYEYLLKIKLFLSRNYGLDILVNLEDFPLNLDEKLTEYYEKISLKINADHINNTYSDYNDRYYIQKIKPFFVKQEIYYEVTFTIANDKVSKFDRIIAFTRHDILDNYAVKLRIREDYIDILNSRMPIKIIDNWEVSIRNCEFKNFSKIFNMQSVHSNSNEYSLIMKYLTYNKIDFVDIVRLSDNYFYHFKNQITSQARTANFINILEVCRNLIRKNLAGGNVISYLLYKLNNKVIKNQLNNDSCQKLSNLNLKWGCIPFDEMPFTTSLINHNPKIHDLFNCINTSNREYEFLARFIKNNAEQKGMLFTKLEELPSFSNVQELMKEYNSKVYDKHTNRKLYEYKGFIYMREYIDNCIDIIQEIKKYANEKIEGYTNSVNFWLSDSSYKIDCTEKLKLLKNMFSQSRVSLVYGAAGTGKSTVINHISHFWNEKDKIYLANTNPAVNNLKRRVTAKNSDFMTISKFLSRRNSHVSCDLLVIDECSTISNQDMVSILRKIDCKMLVLVGDVFQIESILFGNWFDIIRRFVNKSAILELKKPYRTTNENLLTIWNRVRNLDIAILEPMVKEKYSVRLDKSVLEEPNDDEIILCLNYDGIYGINNINHFLQSNNPNLPVLWGVHDYKVNDPILFNESERFTPLIHNNMKGKIVDINKTESEIFFTIELDISINEIDADKYDFELLSNKDSKNSIIKFSVKKYPDTDEDDDSFDKLVPFQVAYAVSIHKSQGLEYKSVKIIITNELEELVSHSIFYTAITRAKENLKIYWSPETEKVILSSFKKKDFSRDIGLLKGMINSQDNSREL
ncbi:MAG: ATP-dependent RecD-like DNA helicase [Haemophilus parainfluenzae]|jgi:helicase, putative